MRSAILLRCQLSVLVAYFNPYPCRRKLLLSQIRQQNMYRRNCSASMVAIPSGIEGTEPTFGQAPARLTSCYGAKSLRFELNVDPALPDCGSCYEALRGRRPETPMKSRLIRFTLPPKLQPYIHSKLPGSCCLFRFEGARQWLTHFAVFRSLWTRRKIEARDGNSLKPDVRRGVRNRAEHTRFCSSEQLLFVSALTPRRCAPRCQGPSSGGGNENILRLPLTPAVFLAVPIPGAIPRPGNLKGKSNEQVTITSCLRREYAQETRRERLLA
jgi:hypothetical protein